MESVSDLKCKLLEEVGQDVKVIHGRINLNVLLTLSLPQDHKHIHTKSSRVST